MNEKKIKVDMPEEKCRYCGGNCPNESGDSPNLCDGFAGDIDKLYSDQGKI